MKLPRPAPGLVIRYAYLWHAEAIEGAVDGSKDRPSVVVLAASGDRVWVAPITHAPPSSGTRAVELPPTTCRSLGLDDERSWVVVDEVNAFRWPGPDLRPARVERWSFGTMSNPEIKAIVRRVVESLRAGRLKRVTRSE